MVTNCPFHSRKETILNWSKSALTVWRKVFSEPMFNHLNSLLREVVKSSLYIFKNWIDFNLPECHVRVLPHEVRQEEWEWTSTKSLTPGPEVLPMQNLSLSPFLSRVTLNYLLLISNEKQQASVFLLCFPEPHAFTYVFHSMMCQKL